MKRLLSALVLVFVTLSCGVAATVGPEVAVMQIKIGKERDLQQVVIGLYDDAAPATVANFKEL